jgi:hypothetical protein
VAGRGPTNADWGKIYAKAWTDREFRKLLETDPTKAIKKYGRQVGKTFTKIVRVSKRPKTVRKPLDKIHLHPPSCC